MRRKETGNVQEHTIFIRRSMAESTRNGGTGYLNAVYSGKNACSKILAQRGIR